MKKRLLSVALACMMVFGLIPLSVTSVFADDSAAEYKELKPGESQWAVIENGGDCDWFVVKPEEDSVYALYTNGAFVDTYCELYDSGKNGSRIATENTPHTAVTASRQSLKAARRTISRCVFLTRQRQAPFT